MDTGSTLLFNFAYIDVSFYPFSWGLLTGLLVLVVLLFFSALISGSEVAFFSLSPADKEQINESKSSSDHLIRELLLLPEKLLATILVANNFINVGIIILSTYLVHIGVDFSNAPVFGFVIEVVAITFILLLFGEILPKIYASTASHSFAGIMAKPLRFCSKLFAPLIYILINSTSFVNRRMAKYGKNISIDELSQALELTNQEDFSEDKGILEGIIRFGTTSVDQIMTPRIDVEAVEINAPFQKILDLIRQSGYSRIPVFKETFDNIEGILYVKDLLGHANKTNDFKWQNLIRPPYFVPENKKIDDLLQEFQKSKVHLAIVVDEYGGTSGIVTLEDILEEIVGDIIDEFDDDDQLFAKVNESTYLFDGKTQLNDFFRVCSINSDFLDEIKGEADTLAGLLLEMKGDFPMLHEKLIYKNIEFIVEAVDKRRIIKIKVVFNNSL
ncbi:gliding motility-associated protein GldE [Roseimarinus sediminis]|uniref:gliding motility-associated protein GldE n=1 Tax=Roseimarinus sediminis TaxID=1610899 RepID=UPI003D1D7BEC